MFTYGHNESPGTQVVSTTTTNAAGQFSFTGLPVSEYLVEVLDSSDGLSLGTANITLDQLSAVGQLQPTKLNKNLGLTTKIILGVVIVAAAFFFYAGGGRDPIP